jgi:hypothetical protein
MVDARVSFLSLNWMDICLPLFLLRPFDKVLILPLSNIHDACINGVSDYRLVAPGGGWEEGVENSKVSICMCGLVVASLCVCSGRKMAAKE